MKYIVEYNAATGHRERLPVGPVPDSDVDALIERFDTHDSDHFLYAEDVPTPPVRNIPVRVIHVGH